MSVITEAAHPRAYGRVAASWSARLARLGYPEAYDRLTASALPAHRLLDVGTGAGDLARAYVARAPVDQIVLTDPSAEMLRQARAALHGHARHVAAHPLALGDDRCGAGFDVVLCGHVLEHLADPGSALRWLHGRLRPGGTLLLSVSHPHWCTALLRWKWGHRAYDASTMTGLLRHAGFDEVEVVHYPAGPPARTSRGYRARRTTCATA